MQGTREDFNRKPELEKESSRPRDFAAAATGGQQEQAEQRGQRHLGRGRARGRQGERLGGEQHHQEDNIVLIVLYLHVA